MLFYPCHMEAGSLRQEQSFFFEGAFFMKVSSLDCCLAFSEQFSYQQMEWEVMHEQKHQR